MLSLRRTLFLPGLFLSLILPVAAHATTYYVNATTGNDAYTTTQAQDPATPWLTLNYAESAATDGDVVHVAAGTYVEDDPSTHGWKVASVRPKNAPVAAFCRGDGRRSEAEDDPRGEKAGGSEKRR
jgi:hypothetical protein